MKTIWAPNPLRSAIELDDRDRSRLHLAIENDMLYEIIIGAQIKAEAGNDKDAIAHLSHVHEIENEVASRVPEYEAFLLEEHHGDCTCQPITCAKCLAERYLGVSTISNLGKHEGAKIARAFGRSNKRTLEEALEALSTFLSIPDEPNEHYKNSVALWNSCLPRWREEQERAHVWLLAYRDEHFPDSR